jgi:hypothetical protein
VKSGGRTERICGCAERAEASRPAGFGTLFRSLPGGFLVSCRGYSEYGKRWEKQPSNVDEGDPRMKSSSLSVFPILLAFPLISAGAGPAPPNSDPEKVKASLIAAAYLNGQLTAVNIEEKKFTLKVEYKKSVLNEKVQQQLTDLSRQYQQTVSVPRPDRNRAANLANQITAAEAKLYDQVDDSIDFEIQGTDKLTVRTLIEPTKEGGGKYSASELVRLRVNISLPGYPLEIKELEKDKWVHVYLDKAKLPSSKAKDPTYTATMIVLVVHKEPPATKTTK